MNDILSICITNKNRSKVEWDYIASPLTLLPDCITSIGNGFSIRDKVEIIITDWASDDWPLAEWMPDHCINPYKVVNIDKAGFSRGYGINEAVKHARGDTIFVMDADMILTSRFIVGVGMQIAASGGAYFPIPKYFTDQHGEYMFGGGLGNMILSKDLFYRAGKLPEYWRYGFEDTDFYKTLETMGVNIASRPEETFIHPWHPQDLSFKEQYIDDDPRHDAQIEQRVQVYKAMRDENENSKI